MRRRGVAWMRSNTQAPARTDCCRESSCGRQARAALHARPVRLVRVPVAGDVPAVARVEHVQLAAGFHDVLRRRRDRHFLPQREVAHAEIARERDVGPPERLVAGRVGALVLVFEVPGGVEAVRVAVPGRDRPRRDAGAPRRGERQRDEVVGRAVARGRGSSRWSPPRTPRRSVRGCPARTATGAGPGASPTTPSPARRRTPAASCPRSGWR